MSRTLELGRDGVRIRYGGAHAATVLLQELHMPYELIDDVRVGLDPAPSPWTLRRVGLSEPITGRRRGRFWTGGKRFFLDLRDPARALVLRCRPGARDRESVV